MEYGYLAHAFIFCYLQDLSKFLGPDCLYLDFSFAIYSVRASVLWARATVGGLDNPNP